MLRNKISLDATFKALDEADENLKIVGYASTDSQDRVNDRILSSAWTKGGLDNFQKNPILLFNHDYNEPIGKIYNLRTDNKGLIIEATVSKNSGRIYNLIKEQVLTTFSVGFLIKDADYDRSKDGLVIKDAELLEVSVVSVPCNQDAVFSVAKSFQNESDFNEFKQQFIETVEAAPEESVPGNKIMDENTISEMIQNALSAQKDADAKAEALAKAEAEKAAALEAQIEKKLAVSAAKIISESEERIASELTKRFADTETTLAEKISGLETALAEKGEIIKELTAKGRQGVFPGANGNSANWKKDFATDVEDAFLLGRVTGKGYNTEFAKDLLTKVNAHSGIEVSSADFEQEVSTNIEMDIQNELILAPMFRELTMNAATMIVPIMPDVGYAEITANAGTTDGVAPHGTLDSRGGTDRAGANLTEVQFQTVKMVAKTYLGNETEEDAIMPILPLLRDSMIRQHARGVENLILLAGHADGAYSGLTAAQGLVKYASTQSRDVNTGTVGTLPNLTAAGLLTLRKGMGKYGLRANDVIYIVSQTGYFNLLEDPEFQDYNLVNNLATKLTGEVGQVYGSPVVVCDEFADPAAGKHYALAVNKRNFLVPRLRGLTVESDYSVEDQHRVLVTTQRLGFKEIIPNAKSVFGIKYPAAS